MLKQPKAMGHLNRAYNARTMVTKKNSQKSKPDNQDITVAALELVKIDMVFAKDAKWAKVWRRSLPKLLEELQFHDYWQTRVRVWKEFMTVGLWKLLMMISRGNFINITPCPHT